jgi:hypothetical protein
VTRDEFVKSAISPDMFGLEVGPGYAPTLPRSKGFNVETLDHATADAIREKYRRLGADISQVEHVDYVSDGRPVHKIIPRRHEYDFILASHVLEHFTDPLGFLKSCELLLKPSGSLVLIVPDKRRCFDAFQSLTTTGDFLQAHREHSSRHAAGRAFDFIANTVGLNGAGIWEKDDVGESALVNSLETAKSIFDSVNQPDAPYIDIHAWRFTPSSLRLIFQDLNNIGSIELLEQWFSDTDNFEFYISLSPSAVGCPLSRIELLRAYMREQIEGGLQLLADRKS